MSSSPCEAGSRPLGSRLPQFSPGDGAGEGHSPSRYNWVRLAALGGSTDWFRDYKPLSPLLHASGTELQSLLLTFPLLAGRAGVPKLQRPSGTCLSLTASGVPATVCQRRSGCQERAEPGKCPGGRAREAQPGRSWRRRGRIGRGEIIYPNISLSSTSPVLVPALEIWLSSDSRPES